MPADQPSTRSATQPAVPAPRPVDLGPALRPAPATEPVRQPGKGFKLEAFYQDGFGLRTADGSNELKLGASTQLDARFYEGDSVAPHSFDIRRARLDLQARLFKRLSVRIQAALEDGNPYIRNAFADLTLWSFLHLRGGQMKVPFSSSWLAFDNQVDFLERGTSEPLYPFFDRGGMVWGNLLGERVTYMIGFYTGVGVDVDAPKGDNDGNKDLAWRLFLQPFRLTPVPLLSGIFLAGNGTWGFGNVPSRRFETRGLTAANFESQVWRWRADQVLGSNGRLSDQLSAEYDVRTRWGAELHYLAGPFTLSAEWAHVAYQGLRVFHDFMQGSKRLKHEVLPFGGGAWERDGGVHNVSVFVSYFITGEQKFLDAFGWKQPKPLRPLFAGGRNGPGAWEVLARFSATLTDKLLFDSVKVAGYQQTDLADPALSPVGLGSSVTAALLEGAPTLYEATLGVNWTMNYHLRVQLDYIYLHAADWEPPSSIGGAGKYGIVSGGNSELYDTALKSKPVESEHTLGLRLIIRI